MAERFGLPRMLANARWHQQAYAANNRDIEALEQLRIQLVTQGEERRAIHEFVTHNVNLSLALLRGNSMEAVRHAEAWLDATRVSGLKLNEADALTAVAIAYFANGQVTKALDVALSGYKLTAGTYLREMYVGLAMVAGVAHYYLGNRLEARALLQEYFGDSVPFTWAIRLLPNDLMARACAIALEEGISVDSANELIRRFDLSPPAIGIMQWPWKLRIRTLGEFEICESGGPLSGGRKVQRKPLDLLKALIALGCRDVPAQRLAEAVWPNLDGDAAMAAFHAALLRLRKLLKHENVLTLQDSKLSLDTARCWIDVAALYAICADIEKAQEAPSPQSLLDLYRGDFLAQEEEAPWLLPARERLRQRFLSSVARLGERLEAKRDWQAAADLYKKALEINNLAEDLYRHLMRCQTQQQRYSEAIDTYRRCRDLLSIVLATKPSPETDALYQRIRQQA